MFTWSEEYSVGVKEIDDQHREFFSIANGLEQLSQAPERGEVYRQQLLLALNRLGNYAFYHFFTEEDYLRMFECPNTETHFLQHESFRKKVKEHIAEAAGQTEPPRKLAFETADFSSRWLAEHILTVDKKYTSCLRQYGLK